MREWRVIEFTENEIKAILWRQIMDARPLPPELSYSFKLMEGKGAEFKIRAVEE